MKITDKLIAKFFENRCTAEEAGHVIRHLKQQPELTTQYLGSSWNVAAKEGNVPKGFTEEMRNAIEVQIRRRTHLIRCRWLAAAASLSMVIVASWLFSSLTKTFSPTLAKRKPETARWKTFTNTHETIYSITLEDGSVVKLAPYAVIRYEEPFARQNQRNIYVEGKADFFVAKNKAKPFVVHTRLISTIALGTSFKVSESAEQCTVTLFEGKVLIKSALSTLKSWKTDMILLPGNEMKYSLKEGGVVISQFSVLDKQRSQSRKNDYLNRTNGALIFNNTALSDVMRTLIARYHSPILFNEKLLTEKYFRRNIQKRLVIATAKSNSKHDWFAGYQKPRHLCNQGL